MTDKMSLFKNFQELSKKHGYNSPETRKFLKENNDNEPFRQLLLARTIGHIRRETEFLQMLLDQTFDDEEWIIFLGEEFREVLQEYVSTHTVDNLSPRLAPEVSET